jgi:urease accessory protein
MRLLLFLSLAVAVAALAPSAAWAHADAHPRGGFVAGFLHPISGLDHVVAMVAVGLWFLERALA